MRIKNYAFVLFMALLSLFSCNNDDSDGGAPSISYTVSFETGEGSAVEDRTVEAGGTTTRPDDPTWEGHTFKGWHTDEALTEEFDFETEVDRDLLLYAAWEIITHTITFDSGEGSTVEDQKVQHGGTATRPEDPNWEGHTFGWWYTDLETQQPFGFQTEVIGDIQLYAKWDAIAYTVSFKTGEGSTVEDQTVEAGGTATRPEDPTRDGYSFGGWYTDEVLTTEFDFASEVTNDLVLYAKWNAIAYTVSFKTGEGSTVEDQTVEAGGTATMPEDPTRDGYSFGGWYADEVLTTEFDFAGEVTSDLILYAKWNAIAYTVSFKTGEGSAVEDQTVEAGGTATMPEDPTRDGYSFGGWYADEVLTTEFDFAGEVTSDLILYAKWMFLPANNEAFRSLLGSGTDPALIDTRLITDMSSLPLGPSFNGDISGWDVSNVTTMRDMFKGATSFNGDISGWDVSNVTNMAHIFEDATSFNGDISGWDVSNVTTMQGMFDGAASFNGDISGWDVSNVTTMRDMFKGATSFNRDISGWDVSKVSTMQGMFSAATSFNRDISGWDVSNVTNMAYTFENATSFNGDISGWDVSNVTTMQGMFDRATSFNGDISGWDVSNVTTMDTMFRYATSFDQNLSGWDVNGKSTTTMFLGATAMESGHYPQGL